MNNPTIQKLLNDAKSRQRHFEASRPNSVDARIVSSRAILPFKALSMREILFQRFCDLNGTAIDLMDRNKWVASYILIRCSIEATALIFQLDKEVTEALRTENVQRTNSFLIRALLGRNGRDAEVNPVNIQSAIVSLNNTHDGFKSAYEELSGFVHPNFDGLLRAYSAPSNQGMVLNLGPRENPTTLGMGIAALLMCMSSFEETYNGLPPKLQEFSALVEGRLQANQEEIET